MEKDKVILEIEDLVNKYNKLIAEKAKPKYGLKPISFSRVTGLVSGEYHKIENFSSLEFVSITILDHKLSDLWNTIGNLVSYYAINFCGISKGEMDRIMKEKEIMCLVDQYNSVVNEAVKKGKNKEGYLPLRFNFQTGQFLNPWHEPYEFIWVSGISVKTHNIWKQLVDVCSTYLSDFMHIQKLGLLQRQMQWHVEGWNTWCGHKKNGLYIKLNEDTHKLEGYILTQKEIESSETAKALLSLSTQLNDAVEVFQMFGYSLEEMSTAVMTEEMDRFSSKKKALNSKLEEIEALLKKYNEAAKDWECPQLSFDKKTYYLAPSLNSLIEVWEEMKNSHTAKYDNFLSKAAETMAEVGCNNNEDLLRSIFSNVGDAKRIADEIERMSSHIDIVGKNTFRATNTSVATSTKDANEEYCIQDEDVEEDYDEYCKHDEGDEFEDFEDEDDDADNYQSYNDGENLVFKDNPRQEDDVLKDDYQTTPLYEVDKCLEPQQPANAEKEEFIPESSSLEPEKQQTPEKVEKDVEATEKSEKTAQSKSIRGSGGFKIILFCILIIGGLFWYFTKSDESEVSIPDYKEVQEPEYLDFVGYMDWEYGITLRLSSDEGQVDGVYNNHSYESTFLDLKGVCSGNHYYLTLYKINGFEMGTFTLTRTGKSMLGNYHDTMNDTDHRVEISCDPSNPIPYQEDPEKVAQREQEVLMAQESEGIKNPNGHSYVDLGLPSGLWWASCNLGASSSADTGAYYSWGETTDKYEYSQSSYSCNLGIDMLSSSYDAAAMQWGGSWRIPTSEDWQELNTYCSWSWDGDGYVVKGRNGNTIYLPAAGYSKGSTRFKTGERGDYWSSNPCGTDKAYEFVIKSDAHQIENDSRHYGLSIRPVL